MKPLLPTVDKRRRARCRVVWGNTTRRSVSATKISVAPVMRALQRTCLPMMIWRMQCGPAVMTAIFWGFLRMLWSVVFRHPAKHSLTLLPGALTVDLRGLYGPVRPMSSAHVCKMRSARQVSTSIMRWTRLISVLMQTIVMLRR